MVKLGFECVGTVDKRYQRTIWENSGRIVFKGNARLTASCRLSCSGEMNFGSDVSVHGNTTFICRKKIVVGNNSLFSWDSLIMDTDFHEIFNENGELINADKEIVIGNNCWFGCRTTILKGVNIPDGCIVSAGSVVRKSFDRENVIIGGNVIVRENVKWRS